MRIIANIRARARRDPKLIALPEVEDDRTYIAARRAVGAGIARIALVGPPSLVRARADELGVSLDNIQVIDPADERVRNRCASLYADLRKHKGVTYEQAYDRVLDPLYCAACLLKLGEVDGSVAGAAHTTADTVRPLLQVVRTAPGVETASSFFLITTEREELGVRGAFIFADAGLVPQPTPEQLAHIAVESADSCRLYLEAEPYVAMLSFSTHGSASHPDIEKVRQATSIARRLRPELTIDGELQADAAVNPQVAARKCPDSPVGGRANVLIFPDLDAGNIGYKLVQHLGGAGAYGPILQGLSRAGMDLSRGATPEDIVNVIAIAVVRAQFLETAYSSNANHE